MGCTTLGSIVIGFLQKDRPAHTHTHAHTHTYTQRKGDNKGEKKAEFPRTRPPYRTHIWGACAENTVLCSSSLSLFLFELFWVSSIIAFPNEYIWFAPQWGWQQNPCPSYGINIGCTTLGSRILTCPTDLYEKTMCCFRFSFWLCFGLPESLRVLKDLIWVAPLWAPESLPFPGKI